jgi:tyrosyl-tRNA synthetase
MSKSLNNYVALTESPKDMYGKLMRTADELITKYFTLLTDVSLEEIKQMEEAMQNGANPMEFKKKLAFTITADLHDQAKAKQAQDFFETAFQQNDLPEKMPEIEVKETETDLLSILKLCQPEQSNSYLRRLCKQGAVRLLPQEEKLQNPDEKIKIDGKQVIKVGKKNFYRLIFK